MTDLERARLTIRELCETMGEISNALDKRNSVCEWQYDFKYNPIAPEEGWSSGCSQNFMGKEWCGPLREGWTHCPYCGGPLEVVPEDREV